MNEDGHAAVELGLGVGLLLIPVALAVLSFGPWSESRVTVEAAAAEATRAAVLAVDVDAGSAVVFEIAENHGLVADDVMVAWCDASPSVPGRSIGVCPMTRGSEVSAQVSVWTPLVMTPWGGVGGLWVSGYHSEPIDLYRSLG